MRIKPSKRYQKRAGNYGVSFTTHLSLKSGLFRVHPPVEYGKYNQKAKSEKNIGGEKCRQHFF
jgi:hypothetical protein